jgi:uncharacterized protein YlxW (UPF0749 family)
VNPTWIISVASLLVCVITFVAAQRNAGRSETSSAIADLRASVEHLERENNALRLRVDELEAVNRRLREENVDLMRRVIQGH